MMTKYSHIQIDPLVLKAGRQLWSNAETRESATAPAFRALFKVLRGERRLRVATLIFEALFRFEGAKVRSRSARELLLESFGIAVGAYTHGEALKPGVFPPNVIIGRYSSIAPGVRAFNQNHPIERLSTSAIFYEPRWGGGEECALDARPVLAIGHDVWLGQNAMITPGCRRIGHGAIVGAGSVVTRDVPAFAVVVGNPARVLRYRFDETLRKAILASQWWSLSPGELFKKLPLGRDFSNTEELSVLQQMATGDDESILTFLLEEA